MEEVAKFGQVLVEHGALYWGVGLMAFAIVCMNGKSLLEGASSFLAEQKRVDGEERRADKAFEEAAERRRTRRQTSIAPPAQKALSPPKDEQLLLPAPPAKPARAKVSTKRRG